ncbi:2-hydroxy-palmitic acid dioxygenase mpo1-like [Gastrolobium bilobum]|uniref:2-hydroxy-palmitic acid dioxygenase mpo1-like n=1 Tax=Gastrolobium bilobum TaxID=150636 RepID=UPI002AB0C99C|nr:2-hydroxy-palmitic acid dioxygenase mpo1-like [Gastrolobium bilobum]
MGKFGLFDLENHFAFYGAYHSNPVNIAIHVLFIWPIFFSTLLILYFIPPFFNLPNLEFSLWGNHVFLVWNVGFLVALIYAIFYVTLDFKAGSLAALLCAICWVSSSFVASLLGLSLAWKVVLVVQLVCWTGQFVGHGVFEKRAPSLLDDLVQALVMAPFFVLLEALQTLFGYESYPGFHSRVQAKIDADIKEWQERKWKVDVM